MFMMMIDALAVPRLSASFHSEYSTAAIRLY
jgi:hypothetical protein